jgi:hypothetical protein
MQTRVPFTVLHFVQSMSPVCFLVQPPLLFKPGVDQLPDRGSPVSVYGLFDAKIKTGDDLPYLVNEGAESEPLTRSLAPSYQTSSTILGMV